MGNRAFITTKNKELGIYLHWNGGRDSVEAFLRYCELRRFRRPEVDGYGWARLAQVIGNYFGGGLSIGIEPYGGDDAARWLDNGIYIIENWRIADRVLPGYGDFTGQRKYDLAEFLADIDEAQPEREQLGRDFLGAEEVPVFDLKQGDEVFVFDGFRCKYDPYEIVEISGHRQVNGEWREGQPVIERYPDNLYENPNNYLNEPTYRRKVR